MAAEATSEYGLIDCHAHLAAHEFSDDLHAVLRRAKSAGVEAVIAVSETADDARRTLDIAAASLAAAAGDAALVCPAVGLHPSQPPTGRGALMTDLPPVLDILRSSADGVVAVGECGLDFTPRVVGDGGESARDAQRDVLRAQAEEATKLGLSLNVHSRGAGHHAVTLLRECGMPPDSVLLHAFDGKAKYAREAAEAGFVLSVPPSIVRGAQFQKMVKSLPLTALALETDAPVLGPTAVERNEPANLRICVREIARLHDVDEEEVARQTTATALRVFPRVADQLRKAREARAARGGGAGGGADAVIPEKVACEGWHED